MIVRTRRAVSLATAALLASGAVTALGAPAHAAGTETDLTITATDTRFAAGAIDGKVAFVRIANQGEGTPRRVLLKVDVSKVDQNKLYLEPFTAGGCESTGDSRPELFTCELAEDIPGPGETADVGLELRNETDGDVTEPYSAPVTISIVSPDDTDDSNNSIDITVELTPESGVDLGVLILDVKHRIALDAHEGILPLRPGDTSRVWNLVYNWGDRVAKGIRLTYQLPEGVTLFPIEGCEISSDKRTAICEDKDFELEPEFMVGVDLRIVVDEDVEAPITLKGGWMEVSAFGALPAGVKASKRATKPSFAMAEVRSIDESKFADLDPSDNKDDFAVVVTAAGGGGGGGGGLPVTGVQAGLIGGVGAAVVVAGAVLFLLSRRRRVVLVTPGDEKTNA
ncbi:hypothetical protein [Micromonospora gifhornensis]|uniref:hypothetical protein n=2 Tax=Micromonospora gifhornensis TaxID=84594 RepID=UPI0031D7BB42